MGSYPNENRRTRLQSYPSAWEDHWAPTEYVRWVTGKTSTETCLHKPYLLFLVLQIAACSFSPLICPSTCQLKLPGCAPHLSALLAIWQVAVPGKATGSEALPGVWMLRSLQCVEWERKKKAIWSSKG